ncbi:MAG TPA: FUSC family protein [Dyella sp.]|uniref:FUSC family protein n=1 Tax=Dyella sp. TaxID=1869338 RepID=UPI002D77887F|nr:FUSC family protein [Dyella sp.]HET6554198.1 FUSC family protein [Dyella sp.]
MKQEKLARYIAFVLRCSGAATLATILANCLGMPHAMWASMSAIIVSQERLNETRNATLWRLAGTLIGIAVSVATSGVSRVFAINLVTQMAFGVAICAAIARRFPLVRVCMWTVPIVYLSKPGEGALLDTALWRCTEVIMGGSVGATFHWVAEFVINRLNRSAAVDAMLVTPDSRLSCGNVSQGETHLTDRYGETK